MTITIADGRGALWQWDTGRRLRVGSGVGQVHYQNKCFGRSVDVDVGDDGTAIIPDELLQDWHPLTAYAYVTDDTGAYTMVQQDFIVHKRAKPAGYVYTPADQMTLQTIQRQIGDLADLTTEAKDTLVAAINEVARTGGAGSMDLRVADGYIQYSTDSGSTWTNLIAVADLKGADGAQGDTGPQGPKGDTGAKGDPGEKGDTGAQGAKGDPGATGPQGAPGKDGANGETGPAGPRGPAGAPGKDGHSPVVTATKSGKTTTISVDGAVIATVEDGADGAPGKDGSPGKNGADGKPGAAGADGITPTIGSNGNWFLGTTDTGKPSRGATGAKGDTGATGPAGPVGPQGPAGAPGKDGANGETGPRGPKGDPGTPGADGAPGKDGAGMDITGATAGQIAKITAVDASGVPTAWEPVDMPSVGSSFTDDGAGNISVDGAAAQSVNRFLQSLTFPGLNFKYINPMNSGTYSNPYGVYVGSGASLVDTILTKTVPGVYTVYMNRNATDVPAAAAAASSSLRGLVILSQIKKHYAIILLVDQSSNFYVQYIQSDVGGGWKQMPTSAGAALPSVTAADNGKILRVVGGAWAAASLPVYNGGVS